MTAPTPDLTVTYTLAADCTLCEGPIAEHPDAELLRCLDCGATWDTDGRQGEPGQGVSLVDTQVAAMFIKRPESTIRRWGHEGRLRKHPRDQHGRDQWNLAEVYRVAAQMSGSR